MKLQDLCVLDVACCSPKSSIAAAAALMREQHAGDLVVVSEEDGDRDPVGILTDRDIVIEVVAQSRDPARTTVAEIMAKPVVVASSAEEHDVALERMRAHGVRRVPVVNGDGHVIGIVTLDDLLRVHAEQAARLLEVVTRQQVRERRSRRSA